MSIQSIINTARRALSASQFGLQIAGHNIANANTPGYTRQRLDVASAPGVKTIYGMIGNGVELIGLERVRDRLADQTFRRETALRSEFEFRRNTLAQVEGALSEMTEAGIGMALSQFFDSWNDLSSTPTGSSQRESVRQRAMVVVQRLNNAASRIDDISREIQTRLVADVDLVNHYSKEVALLNEQIIKAEGGGTRLAPDLRDARDALLDKMSGVVGVLAIERPNGTISLIAGDSVLADGTFYREVELRFDALTERYSIGYPGVAASLSLESGRVGSAMELLNDRIPAFVAELDAIVEEMVTLVNGAHTTGTTSGGATGIAFFEPGFVTAANVRVSAAVMADRDNIVTGTTGEPGDAGVALTIARLRYERLPAFAGDTLPGALVAVSVRLGLQIDNARSVVESQDILVNQVDMQRTATSGVSTEEELVSLMRFQHAYQAAAKVINVADEMMMSLINMR
jgi:flagellar hook-associated protein 1